MSFNINNSSESQYGTYSSYVKMNPYWEPYDKEGYVVRQFETESTALFTSPVDNHCGMLFLVVSQNQNITG